MPLPAHSVTKSQQNYNDANISVAGSMVTPF